MIPDPNQEVQNSSENHWKVLCEQNRAEPELPTRHDVVQENANMLVPVRASLLMVEAQRVEHLMLDDLLENTTLAAQRHRLGPPPTTNKRVAPEDTEET